MQKRENSLPVCTPLPYPTLGLFAIAAVGALFTIPTNNELALQLLRGKQGEAEVAVFFSRGRSRAGLRPRGRRADGLVEEHATALPERQGEPPRGVPSGGRQVS